MNNESNTTRKQIAFHMDIPEEKNACEMIDKVRYFQTAFIAKLANDFFAKHGLTLSTPYKVVQNVVRSYIAGALPENDHTTASTSVDNAMMMMIQMQTAMMQQLNAQQMSLMNAQQVYANQNPVVPNTPSPTTPISSYCGSPVINAMPSSVPVSESPAKVLQNSDKEHPYINPNYQNEVDSSTSASYNDIDPDDEDEMDDTLSKFAAGFSSMLDS